VSAPDDSPDPRRRRPAHDEWSTHVTAPVSTTTADDAPDPAPRAGTRRRTWGVVTWALLSSLCLAWALASPLMSAPDEPAHATKAASVVRGQWLGDDVGGANAVDVPPVYWQAQSQPLCYFFQPEVPADCAPPLDQTSDETVYAETTAGRYNPVYYLAVGWVTLVDQGVASLWAMRVLTALGCAALLAVGLTSLREVPRPGWLLASATVAVTPMVVYLSGNISPAGPEIAAAFAAWATLLATVRDPRPDLLPHRMARVAVAASLLVNMRGLSPLFLAAIVLTALVAAPWHQVGAVLRDRRSWLPIAVVGVATAAATAWIVGTNSLGSGQAVAHPSLTFRGVLTHSLLSTWIYLQNMFGHFGWVDTWLPTWLYVLMLVAVAVLVVLALWRGGTRDRLVLLALGSFTIVAPAVIHASQAQYLGIIWQGRYFLPVAVGMALYAGWALHDARRGTGPLTPSRALAAYGSAWVVVQTVAVTVLLQRFMNGAHGRPIVEGDAAWTPPVAWWVLVLVVAASTTTCVVLAHVATRDRAPVPGTAEVAPT